MNQKYKLEVIALGISAYVGVKLKNNLMACSSVPVVEDKACFGPIFGRFSFAISSRETSEGRLR